MMSKTEQQQEATRFSFDYLNYLMEQEGVVDRVVERKLRQLEPRLEQLIDQKIDQRFKKLINNK
ncbi:MAG: hypothetical protein IJV44_08915 [Prevotella sp.]|nr:hypothetical protein [Prevotella sp.]